MLDARIRDAEEPGGEPMPRIATSLLAVTSFLVLGSSIASAGTATQIAFRSVPTQTAGLSQPVTVAIEDATGNTVTTDNTTVVTLTLSTNPTGITFNQLQATAVSGVATFHPYIYAAASGYQFSATSNPVLATNNPSVPFTVRPNNASKLAFGVEPSSG